MYDVANEDKYNIESLEIAFNSYEKWELQGMNGIMKGALQFIKLI